MKAIGVHEFGGPEVMRLEEVPDPKPGAGEVVVRVRAAGVNPVDTYIRSGTYARKPALPYTPGSDAAGEVVSTGTGVTQFAIGDRVYTAGSLSGTYAELALCNLAQVHPLPARTSFAEGAAIGVPYGTAYRGLFQRAHGQPGETVLVHGASGGVGIAAVQLARAAGMVVIGTAGTAQGRKLVQDAGAHHVLDHSASDYLKELPHLTGGRGVDVVLEMLANQNLAADLGMLAMRGRVVVIGNRGTIQINPRDAMSREADVLGMSLVNTPAPELASIHAALVAGLDIGTLRPVVGKQLPLGDASRAHEDVMKPGAQGKIVLLP
jgi:NADPH2:quinone reductase